MVFDEEYALDTGFCGVVFDVHTVFDEFYDGEYEVGVSQPAEDVVEDGEVDGLYALCHAVREWCKHDARCVR